MTPDRIADALSELAELGLARRRHVLDGAQGARVSLDGRACLSFASNDYLGLAGHADVARAAIAAIERVGVGAGAAHLLTGHHRLHHDLETRLAGFVGLPAALLFSTGYMASLGVLPALLDRHAEVFEDRLNHASLIDGAILARARLTRYPHLDLDWLDRKLGESTASTRLIATDTVFSMDGDLAPVPALLELAEKHDAWLYLDDAHGFGVLGDQGRGILEHAGLASPPRRLIYLATLGKAAGVAGAFVAGSTELVEWLVNRARTWIYTTAQPPLLAAAVGASLDLIASEPWRRRHLRALIARFRAGVAGLPWPSPVSDTPIQPLLVGTSQAAVALAEGLRARAILAPAIRPPTVPHGEARLRVSLSAAHTPDDVDELLAALRELARG